MQNSSLCIEVQKVDFFVKSRVYIVECILETSNEKISFCTEIHTTFFAYFNKILNFIKDQRKFHRKRKL